MQIRSIHATNIVPVKLFHAENLSDLVVVAGPNGVGKTRFIQNVINYFQNPNASNPVFEIVATHEDEVKAWGKSELRTSIASDAELLRTTLQRNQKRKNFRSTILYYESNRSIKNVKPLAFSFDYDDPYEEQIPWKFSYGGLSGRWQDTQHAIFKKIQEQKSRIANRAIQLRRDGHDKMNLEFEDPLTPFRAAFSQLLGPKKLHNADLQNQTLQYKENEEVRSIDTLSSGEKEVLTIVFDFILRSPSNCVVFFDEPELHLHPELLSRMISTLRNAGKSNQFFLLSHSPDVIASSLDDTVIFLRPSDDAGSNQAVLINANDETAETLHRLGQSVGVVALGRKIVLIEGTEASLDKQTYSHLLKNRHPDLVLVPSGGKGNLASFSQVATDVLGKSVWGIQFFMLADRDATPSSAKTSVPTNFKQLTKYHLENYFLDADVLRRCFKGLAAPGSWMNSSEEIEAKICGFALQTVPYATSLIVSKTIREKIGNVGLMPKDCIGMSKDELINSFSQLTNHESSRISDAFNEMSLSDLIVAHFEMLENEISSETDHRFDSIPGRPILHKFASAAELKAGQLKNLYISNSEDAEKNPFGEIIEVFNEFALA